MMTPEGQDSEAIADQELVAQPHPHGDGIRNGCPQCEASARLAQRAAMAQMAHRPGYKPVPVTVVHALPHDGSVSLESA